MQIKLAPGQNFWMLLHPADNSLLYYLSKDAPGPIEIDMAKLTLDNQEAVKNGLYYRIILDASHEELADPAAVSTVLAEKESQVELQARSLVQLSIAAFQRQLPDVLRQDNALAVLDMMVDLENRGENASGAPRKTLVQMMERIIANMGGITAVKEDAAYEVTINYDTPVAP